MRHLGFLILLFAGMLCASGMRAQVTDSTATDTTRTDSVRTQSGVKGSGVKGGNAGTRVTVNADSLKKAQDKAAKENPEDGRLAGGPRIRQADSTKVKNIPRRAALLSAALPGAGQVYNGRIWKVPIIYAGLGAIGYFAIDNHKSYAAFRDAFAIVKADSLTEYEVDLGNGPRTYQFSDLLTNRENFRRYRDLNIILGGVWYTLNVLDAYVDAHLKHFDVSDDLSLQVKPKLMFHQASGAPVLGAAFTLHLR